MCYFDKCVWECNRRTIPVVQICVFCSEEILPHALVQYSTLKVQTFVCWRISADKRSDSKSH